MPHIIKIVSYQQYPSTHSAKKNTMLTQVVPLQMDYLLIYHTIARAHSAYR